MFLSKLRGQTVPVSLEGEGAVTHLSKLKLAFEFFHFRGPLIAEVSAISKSSITFSCAAVNGAWSGLSESNRHLNLGKSAGNGASTTYEALSGALSSI